MDFWIGKRIVRSTDGKTGTITASSTNSYSVGWTTVRWDDGKVESRYFPVSWRLVREPEVA